MIAELIKMARKEAGLSQTKLAEKAGLKQLYITRLERGKTNPGWETVVSVVGGLGYSLQDFLNKYTPQAQNKNLIKNDK